MAVAAVSSAFLLGLLYVYVKNHRALRTPFTLGLVFFAGLLLVQNLGSVYFFWTMSQAGEGPAVAVPMLGLDMAGLIGFAALFTVTWR